MRESGKILLWAGRTGKAPLRVAREKAARKEQAEETMPESDRRWWDYVADDDVLSHHPLAAWVRDAYWDDNAHVVAPRPPAGVTYTFAGAT